MAIPHFFWLPWRASRSRTHPPYGNRSRAICPEKSTGVPELLLNTVDLSSWLDFEAAVRDLERRRRELESRTSRSFGVQLFRGLGGSTWGPVGERSARTSRRRTRLPLGVQLFRGLGSSTWGRETTLETAIPARSVRGDDRAVRGRWGCLRRQIGSWVLH